MKKEYTEGDKNKKSILPLAMLAAGGMVTASAVGTACLYPPPT